MSPMALLLACAVLGSAGAERQSYLFFLQGEPVGVVSLSREGRLFRYRSDHFFAPGSAEPRTRLDRSFAFDGSGRVAGRDAMPEALALWHLPVSGCTRVLDERTGQVGELCVEPAAGNARQGMLLGQPFKAEYRRDRLFRLVLPGARFEATSSSPVFVPPDLFEAGFAIEGASGPFALDPPLAVFRPALSSTARDPEPIVSKLASEQRGSNCLKVALEAQRRLAAAGINSAVVYGLVVMNGRAYPHAWITLDYKDHPRDLDPALDLPFDAQHRLVLGYGSPTVPSPSVGQLYWELLVGKRKVERCPR